MTSLRFINIAQPTFPNQRKDERVFVFSRRHPIDFLFFAIVAVILFFVPIVFIILLLTAGSFLQSAGVGVTSIVILSIFFYYIFLSVLTLSSWIIYYYNVFVVTDERIVEVAQTGLFSREIHELIFEQIEDVSTKTRGILNTFFDAGDIEIQTAGTDRNFYVRRISHAEAAVEIINELTHQARENISTNERYPQLANIGLLNGKLVPSDGVKPKIMNLDANLENNNLAYSCGTFKPKNLRERFDYLWWRHCHQMIVTAESKDERKEVTDLQMREIKKIEEANSGIEQAEVSKVDEAKDSRGGSEEKMTKPQADSSVEQKTEDRDSEVHQIEEIDDDKNN